MPQLGGSSHTRMCKEPRYVVAAYVPLPTCHSMRAGAGAHARTCLRVRDGRVASTVRDVGSRGADKGANATHRQDFHSFDHRRDRRSIPRSSHRAVSVTGGSRLYIQPRGARMDPVVALAPQSGTAGRRQLSVGSRVRQAHDRSTDHPHYPTSCPRFSRTAGERARRRHGTRGAGRWLVSRRPFAAPASLRI